MTRRKRPATAELLSSTAAKDDTKDSGKSKDKKTKKADPDKPVVLLEKPGKPATAEVSGADAPALVGTATGPLAPGWTAQQTTTVEAGDSRGLLGVSCTAPDTDFWFPAASTAKSREDYVHLTNPDDTAAVADIELYGPDGTLKSDVGEGITVPASSGVRVLISTLTSKAADDVTVHVTTRTGRVGAVVRSADSKTGSDWLAASTEPTGTLVLPGIPADATSVRLVAFAPGEDDADLTVKLLGKTGAISPVGHEDLHVKSRMTAACRPEEPDQGRAGLPAPEPRRGRQGHPGGGRAAGGPRQGRQPGSRLHPGDRPGGRAGDGSRQPGEGFGPLAHRPRRRLSTVKVTASAGSKGGTPVTKTYEVPASTTVAVTPPVPAGLKGTYALTVETQSGGPVHASRTLTIPMGGIPMFTVQTLPDDRGTVEVPAAEQDLSVLDD